MGVIRQQNVGIQAVHEQVIGSSNITSGYTQDVNGPALFRDAVTVNGALAGTTGSFTGLVTFSTPPTGLGVDTDPFDTKVRLSSTGLAYGYVPFQLGGSDVPPTRTTIDGAVKCRNFATENVYDIDFAVTMPANWKVGTAVTPVIIWASGGLGKNLKWQIDICACTVGSAISADDTDAIELVTHASTANMVVRSAFADIDTTGWALHSSIIGSITRPAHTGGAGDAASAYLIGAGLLYQIDSFGSDAATTKT